MFRRRAIHPPPAPSATLKSGWAPKHVEEQEFDVFQAPAGVESTLARYRVPDHVALALDVKPLRVYIPAIKETEVNMSGGAPATTTLTFPGRLVTSPRGDARDYQAVAVDAGGTETTLTVTAYDELAGTVTVDTSGLADGTYTIRAWALPGEGTLTLAAEAPGGTRKAAFTLLTKPFNLVHRVNQADPLAGFRFANPYVLGPHWGLTVIVNTPFTLDWGRADFDAAARVAQIVIHDPQQAERELRMQFGGV